uniref:Uncharacterized protein n=1 Tax=Rhizophagus irregularis (strain DAOM 181602 / DAOM 197198 / MUCL 43194) TaxID=747089 RepID=U9UBZ7_RHIID
MQQDNRRTSGCMKSANVDFQFLDTQVLGEPLVNDEEFVSKEELATARLYFKQPGHMVELQALKCVNNCFDTVTNSVLTSDYSILQALKKPWEETREKDKKREPITS